MKVKHLVIDSCRVCPFMTMEGERSDPQSIYRCEAIEDNRRNRLKYIEGGVMQPIETCPLDDYDTETSPENVVREHVKAKAQRWKEHNNYIKAGGPY